MTNCAQIDPILRGLVQQKDWQKVDAYIDPVALSADLAEAGYYKIVALHNLPDKRNSVELQQLLQQQIDFGNNVVLYQKLLTDILLETSQYERAMSLLLSFPAHEQQSSEYFYKLVTCAKAVSNKDMLAYAVPLYHYFISIELIQAGKHEQANRFLSEIVRTEPENQYYRWLLATNLQLLGKHETVIEVAQSLSGDFAEAALRLKLQTACSASQPVQIEKYAKALLNLVADDIQALHALASAASMQNNVLEALRQYQLVLELYPFDVLASLKSIFWSKQLAQRPLTALSEIYNDEECLLLSKALFNAGYKKYALSIAEERCFVEQPQQEALMLTADFCAQMYGDIEAFNFMQRHMANWLQWPTVGFKFARYGIKVIDNIDKNRSDNKNFSECFVEEVLSFLRQMMPGLNGEEQIVARYLMQETRYHLTRNFTYLTVDEYPSAEADYLAYAGLVSRDGMAYMRLAQLKMTADDLAAAQEYVVLAKQRHQYSFFLHFISAKFYNHCSKWKEAIKQATDGINMYATGYYVFLHIERCIAATQLGNTELALIDLDIISGFTAHSATHAKLKHNLDEIIASRAH
ncbi:hypothetical protein ORJ04_20055 [Rheinheimera baltica]|uniref:Uncharacterized protein n=1 Tax=Rheinheimera baltica TaxID=67576 RepID=A0ABT9I4C9_9GAMM|nr:hypothetical protein [Rheinheimera baltica]MDP5138246.1 hypothetical protein [Rheinheimera baltica]MDP5151172.1 hypothetical protein [Rheinheimera baltica]